MTTTSRGSLFPECSANFITLGLFGLPVVFRLGLLDRHSTYPRLINLPCRPTLIETCLICWLHRLQPGSPQFRFLVLPSFGAPENSSFLWMARTPGCISITCHTTHMLTPYCSPPRCTHRDLGMENEDEIRHAY